MWRIMMAMLVCVMGWADDFGTYKETLMSQYHAYYTQEMKAYQGFIQTSDGIANKVNPYQKMSIIPPSTTNASNFLSVVSTLALGNKVMIKRNNTLPNNTPSGSQLLTVKLNAINVAKLTSPEIPPKIPSVITPIMMQLSFFGTLIPLDQNLFGWTKTLKSSDDVSILAQQIHDQDTPLIQALKGIQTRYQLNDWDSVLLVQTLMNTLYPNDTNGKLKTIHAIDILRGLGYKALLGQGGDTKYYLFLSIQQEMYAKSFFQRGNDKLYIFSINAHPRANFTTSIRFFSSPYDGQGSAIDMIMHRDPALMERNQSIQLRWTFEEVGYTMMVNVNKNLTDLMDMYPQSDYAIYMQSRSGNRLIQNMAQQLKHTIQERQMDEPTAVHFILRFVQEAFAYKSDFESYGYERPMFPDQTVLLPYSDCEDRATMLSRLYREVLGKESVGLYYPGHMSLGLRYDGNGDYYTRGDARYFVTDGTYFYAPPGMSQPSFKNATATLLMTQ